MNDSDLNNKQLRDFDLEEFEHVSDSDVMALAAQFGLSFIPFWGSALGTIVSNAFLKQRLDKEVQYFKLLGEHITGLEEKLIRSRLALPGNLDIFAEGARQAAEAITEEKIPHIATFVGKAITDAEIDVLKIMSTA